MVPYSRMSEHSIPVKNESIHSFITIDDSNIDWKTVDSFGEEWEKFSTFSEEEIKEIGNDYFDIVPKNVFENAVVLDVGCGSGRWSKFLTEKVQWIEAIDPSSAVISAYQTLSQHKNIRVTQASTEGIPFQDESFDLVISLGVLHHIPNTQQALNRVVDKVKKGGACLIYLYYNLDNRGLLFKALFWISHVLRIIINKLPSKIKKFICDFIAIGVYWPLSRMAGVIKNLLKSDFYKLIPLSYYYDKSLNILRNDALDRFGTPLEQRFSRNQISDMMAKAGLENIAFSDKEPFWHAIGYRK